jgi:hypothetical protein
MSQVIQFDDRYAHKKGILIPEIWFQDALEVFRQIFTFSKNLLEYIDYFSIFGYNRIESKICRNRGVVYDGVYQAAHGRPDSGIEQIVFRYPADRSPSGGQNDDAAGAGGKREDRAAVCNTG